MTLLDVIDSPAADRVHHRARCCPRITTTLIRMFSLIASLAIFVLSLGLIGPVLVQCAPGKFAFETERALDPDARHQLSRRPGRHQPVAGDPFHVC